MFLDSVGPKFHELQLTARAGMFPGVEAGITSLMDLLPRLSSIVGDISEGLGQLASSSGAGLSGEGYAEFFDYLDARAKPLLIEMGETIGNFAEGIGAMIVAFAPLTDKFSAGLLGMSESFVAWSQGLSESTSFQDFLGYIEQSTPKVLSLFGDLVDMVVSLGKAAAPVGDIMLPTLRAIADAVSAIADSPLGPVFLAAAAAVSVYGRAVAAAGLFTSGLGQKATAAINPAAIKASIPSVRDLGTAMAYSAHSTAALTTAMGSSSKASATGAARALEARGRIVEFGKAAGPAAAAAAGLAIATTGVGDSLGLTNTATFALMGTLAGPWGAAAAGAVGLLSDISKKGDAAESAMSSLNSSAASAGTDFVALAASVDNGWSSVVKYREETSLLTEAWEGWDKLFTGESAFDSVAMNFAEQEAAAKSLREAYIGLATGMGAIEHDSTGVDLTPSLADLTRIAQTAGPALEKLGYTLEEVRAMGAAGDSLGLVELGMDVANFIRYSESAEGRADALATAFDGLSDPTLEAAAAATELQTALDNLLGPELNAEEATDAWRASLAELAKELKSSAGFDGFTKGALANRQVTRDYVEDSKARLVALAGVSTTTEGQMARAVAKTRSEFIKSGLAAGFSRKEIVARAREMGLTPKLVRTVFKAAGIEESTLRIREARANLERLPKKVQTYIRTEGIPKSMAEINGLTKRLDLTERERQALIVLRDLASNGIGVVNGKLVDLDRARANPTANLIDQATGTIAAIINGLGNIHDKSVTVTTYHRDVRVGDLRARRPTPSTTAMVGSLLARAVRVTT